MKRAERTQMRDTAIPTHTQFLSRKANVKNDTETASKKIPARGLKGPSTKYAHSDLREQNRQLVSGNEELQRQISEMKEHEAALELHCNSLQEENTEMKKQLQDCYALLIAENLDPVSGGKLGKTYKEKEGQRRDLMTVSQDLLTELKLFDEVAREHGTNLLEVQNTTRSLKEAREKLQQDRESFCLDVEEMERALEAAERLLIE